MVHSDLTLARRLERLEGAACQRFVEARSQITPGSGACWIEVAGAYAMFDTPDSPITQTFGLGMFEPVTATALTRLEEFFFDRGARVHHEVSPLAGVETFALLAERGYRPIELTSVMYRPTGVALDVPANPRLQVRIAGPEERELWARTGAAGWSSEFAGAGEFILDLGMAIAAKGDAVALLAELDGLAAGTGSLSLHAGAGLMAGASTVPKARRQGVQLALLDARLRYAADHGCDLAMMCAAPGSGSQRNAERHGFRIAYTRVKWELHPRS